MAQAASWFSVLVVAACVCACALILMPAAVAAAAAAAAPASDDGAGSPTLFLFVFTEQCWTTFFHDFDFLNVPCLKSLLSKGVGMGIIAGSFLLKAPQIFNIVKARSGRGLEPSALYLDVAAFICPAIYSFRLGHPFLSYGESVVILVQNVIIVLLVWAFSPKEQPVSLAHKAGVATALVAATTAGFALPAEYLQVLPTISIVLVISSRLPQIAAFCRTKDTGVSSSITWLLNFVGAIMRVLTTLNETGDLFQMAAFAIGASCSGVILVQVCMYGGSSAEKAGMTTTAPKAPTKGKKGKSTKAD